MKSLRRILDVLLIVGIVACVLVAIRMWMLDERYPTAPTTSTQSSLPITIIAWNVESGGSDPATIADELSKLEADIYALSEVSPNEFERFARGWPSIHTGTGRDDRVQIIVNPNRFELLRRLELDELNDGRHRSPLVAHLREKRTGIEFLLVAVHLARGNEQVRLMQAEGLVAWARDQSLPIVAIGDFNFDFDFQSQNGNEAFKAFMRDGIFKWIKPKDWIDTNWADFNRDGRDDYPDSMLDFAFVAGPAVHWQASCESIVRPGDFPDNPATSDHRPICVAIRSSVH